MRWLAEGKQSWGKEGKREILLLPISTSCPVYFSLTRCKEGQEQRTVGGTQLPHLVWRKVVRKSPRLKAMQTSCSMRSIPCKNVKQKFTYHLDCNVSEWCWSLLQSLIWRDWGYLGRQWMSGSHGCLIAKGWGSAAATLAPIIFETPSSRVHFLRKNLPARIASSSLLWS